MFAAQFVLNGFVIYIATYFQHVLGYGPLLAAVAMVPSMLPGPTSTCCRPADRPDRRPPPAIAGYLLTTFSFAWIAVFIDQAATGSCCLASSCSASRSRRCSPRC